MLEEKDLQAIQKMMDAQTQAFDAKLNLLVENVFEPRFNLLAENQQTMLEKLERLDDIDVIDTRVTALVAMVKKLNREMAQLKRAN